MREKISKSKELEPPNEKINGINRIGLVGFKYHSSGGGNIHFKNLIPCWESSGIKISSVKSIMGEEFSFLSVFRATIKAMFLRADKFSDISKNDIILSVSPYPMDFILAFRLSHKYKRPLTVYIHHITPSILIHPYRRGTFRVFLNVSYITVLLAFLNHFKIPIFLDNPRTLTKHSMKVFPDFDAIPKVVNSQPPLEKPRGLYDITYIGRIENHKGVMDIIKVVEILIKKYSMPLKVILAGRGEEKYVNKIKKIIKKLDLAKNIILKGFILENEKYELLRNSKVFLFLSYEEGWAISVMEAASMGTPVVAYSLPAYYYLRGNYFPVKVGNIQLCADTVKQILDNYGTVMEKTMKAKECVDSYSYNFIAKQQLIFFSRIAEEYKVSFHE
ncbi:glycosyltransferase family 4 protein [Cuniculiplasma divulgatum]|uniref:Glycosyltransferase n=1 Tax=Cuniculiplasma divulgatum TaxID=1673428 RepID=A0A1N5UJE9_9ARCH|nr:glycosyltransferase [Cuniculiplasma divulgatum]SIM60720.1 glycosyltransferase [Cuniculiplasma divulgatum]SJK84836.1 glycosyltransferase [Cuniculiplasma divulgatum]